jgi:hypothetical protein
VRRGRRPNILGINRLACPAYSRFRQHPYHSFIPFFVWKHFAILTGIQLSLIAARLTAHSAKQGRYKPHHMLARKIHWGMGVRPRHCYSVDRSQRSGSHDDSKTLQFLENFSHSPCFRMNYRTKPTDSSNCGNSLRKLLSNMGRGGFVVHVHALLYLAYTTHYWARPQMSILHSIRRTGINVYNN